MRSIRPSNLHPARPPILWCPKNETRNQDAVGFGLYSLPASFPGIATMPNFHGRRHKQTVKFCPCPPSVVPFPAQWVEPGKDHVCLRHAGLLQVAEVESGDRLSGGGVRGRMRWNISGRGEEGRGSLSPESFFVIIHPSGATLINQSQSSFCPIRNCYC